MTQRYATGSGGILSLSPASWFKIFGMGWMQCEVECKPEHLGIPDKPHTEKKCNQNHDGQRESRVSNSEQVIEHRPRAKRRKNGERIADRNVRQKVATLAHEEKSAVWAADWTIEISVKKLSLTANRTSQPQQRSELHAYILTPRFRQDVAKDPETQSGDAATKWASVFPSS